MAFGKFGKNSVNNVLNLAYAYHLGLSVLKVTVVFLILACVYGFRSRFCFLFYTLHHEYSPLITLISSLSLSV